MILSVSGKLPTDAARLRRLPAAHIQPSSSRCVQCGICSYSCPIAIDVRGHARRGLAILTPAGIRREHLEEGIRDFEDCAGCHPTGGEEEAERRRRR